MLDVKMIVFLNVTPCMLWMNTRNPEAPAASILTTNSLFCPRDIDIRVFRNVHTNKLHVVTP
jgi:hypothetical protein